MLQVDLPGVPSAADVKLDIGRAGVSLTVPSRFQLQRALPYNVDPEASTACYDRCKQQLSVTMPVVHSQQPLLDASRMDAAPADVCEAAATRLSDCDSSEPPRAPPAGDPPAVVSTAAGSRLKTHNQLRWDRLHSSNKPADTNDQPQQQQQHGAGAPEEASGRGRAPPKGQGKDPCSLAGRDVHCASGEPPQAARQLPLQGSNSPPAGH